MKNQPFCMAPVDDDTEKTEIFYDALRPLMKFDPSSGRHVRLVHVDLD